MYPLIFVMVMFQTAVRSTRYPNQVFPQELWICRTTGPLPLLELSGSCLHSSCKMCGSPMATTPSDPLTAAFAVICTDRNTSNRSLHAQLCITYTFSGREQFPHLITSNVDTIATEYFLKFDCTFSNLWTNIGQIVIRLSPCDYRKNRSSISSDTPSLTEND